MNRLQYGAMIMVAFLGGLIGGMVSTRFLSGEIAFAKGGGIEFRQKQIYADKIIAEEFFLHEKKEISDLDGEIPIPRAILTTGQDGDPTLIMQDKAGNPRLSIGLTGGNGATMAIMDARGNRRAFLAENGSHKENPSGPTMTLLDDDGEIRAQMGVRVDGNPFLSLNDPRIQKNKSGRGIHLCLQETDKAKIAITGLEDGQQAALLIDSKDTRLSLRDAKGQIRAELGNTELSFGKDGILEKYSNNAFPVEKRPASSMVLYDENGKVLWSAP